MADTRFLAVKNWEKFQHYKDRSPPWIKFYAETLDDLAFTMLPEAAQAQLMKLWLFASKCANCIPWDRRIISQAIKAGPRLYLKEIMAAGFVYELQQNASNGASTESPPALAASEPDAMPSRAGTRAREEGREQRTETASSAREAMRSRDQLLTALSPTRRMGMTAALAMWETGSDLPAGIGVPTPEQIDTACRDVLASCELGTLTVNTLRGFLVKVMRPTTNGQHGSYLESELARLKSRLGGA